MFPQRIISLVPSQTELLFDLGLDQQLVGLTKFCIHPAGKVNAIQQVGGTKTLNLETIHALKPDLLIANKEENTRAEIEALQRHYPVHVTDITTLPDALEMIREVGELTGTQERAHDLADDIAASFDALTPPAGGIRPRVAYFIWRKPWMVAASDTFIHHMLDAAGFRNAFADRTRYPEISEDELRAAQPDLIFLSSEPYPFKDRHLDELQAICPAAEVRLVDGEAFSWYGSRLLHSAAYFQSLRQAIGLDSH